MRPEWKDYFLALAKVVSSRATCPRASVGAVIVRQNQVVCTGYNGSLPGEVHCTDRGCSINKEGHCSRAVHAEVNAVAQAAKFGLAVNGCTMYVYDSINRGQCCLDCDKVVKSAGIIQVIF